MVGVREKEKLKQQGTLTIRVIELAMYQSTKLNDECEENS